MEPHEAENQEAPTPDTATVELTREELMIFGIVLLAALFAGLPQQMLQQEDLDILKSAAEKMRDAEKILNPEAVADWELRNAPGGLN